MQVAQQGEAGQEAQVSTGGGARGRAKQLEEAKEDVGGEEQQDDRADGGVGDRPEDHHGCPQQAGEAPPGAGGVRGG